MRHDVRTRTHTFTTPKTAALLSRVSLSVRISQEGGLGRFGAARRGSAAGAASPPQSRPCGPSHPGSTVPYLGSIHACRGRSQEQSARRHVVPILPMSVHSGLAPPARLLPPITTRSPICVIDPHSLNRPEEEEEEESIPPVVLPLLLLLLVCAELHTDAHTYAAAIACGRSLVFFSRRRERAFISLISWHEVGERTPPRRRRRRLTPRRSW